MTVGKRPTILAFMPTGRDLKRERRYALLSLRDLEPHFGKSRTTLSAIERQEAVDIETAARYRRAIVDATRTSKGDAA